jgi:hypothetical protein
MKLKKPIWVAERLSEQRSKRPRWALRETISVSLNTFSKEFRPKGPCFGLPPGRGLSMSLLLSSYLWSTPSLLEFVVDRADSF